MYIIYKYIYTLYRISSFKRKYYVKHQQTLNLLTCSCVKKIRIHKILFHHQNYFSQNEKKKKNNTRSKTNGRKIIIFQSQIHEFVNLIDNWGKIYFSQKKNIKEGDNLFFHILYIKKNIICKGKFAQYFVNI